MAKFIGGPSKYLENERFWSKYKSTMWMVGLITSYFVYLFINSYLQNAPLAATILGFAMLLVYKLLNGKAWQLLRRAGKFKRGLDGEALVADELRKLSDAYTVIQDVQIPEMKTNIDFVVLGPTGIWAIEVKSHDGHITYNNSVLARNGFPFEKNILWQTKQEVKQLTDHIQSHIDRGLFVHGMLVFSSSKARMSFGEKPIEDISIIGLPWLNRVIQNYITLGSISQSHSEEITKLLTSSSA